ncbi:MAG: hypothetical protein ACK5IQ_09775 [Bacteroidales bacterium]
MKIRFATFSIITSLVLFCTAHLSDAQDVNQSDSQGRKIGKWIAKHDNGRTKYEGIFKDGKPTGEMKKYYSSGIMSAKLLYCPNSDSVHAELFDKSSKPIASGTYIGTDKIGRWQYFQNGRLAYKQDYSNNLKHGKRFMYFNDGSMFEISTWNKDSLNGEYKTFFPKIEKVDFEASYLNGKLNGDSKTYFENGQIEAKGKYKNGKQEGTWEYFNDKGEHRYTLEYIDGRMQANESYDSIQTQEINSLLKHINDKRPDPEKYVKDPYQYLQKIGE